ncbi:receptor-like protein 12 [Durio zibethinus]|uniref:Receptor-like protein 12 n=1 Tax=Durio zibethinus TaxID=66656 RepID=A0A6P6A4D5_DURZI|nr:receptor-like protein 12 [Durio zibethinus]
MIIFVYKSSGRLQPFNTKKIFVQLITMGPLLHYSLLKCLLYVILPHLLTQCVSSMQRPCLDSERSALLQLKESFILNRSASSYPLAYLKVGSWKLEGQGDCCSWDGVECDDNTGHVIGLDLSSSFLYASIDSNSSLFHLHHLRRLNLSGNDFNDSKIPSAIGNLSRLSHLDLSSSGFSGQIPSEVLELPKLVILDLSGNIGLELQNPSLKSLAEKLVNLEYLNLDEVNASSTIPQSLANLSYLIYLSLGDCELRGEFPIEIFQLPNLQYLEVSDNPYLTGHLPEFHKSSYIESLALANTGFSGELPKSIGNLKSLSHLSVQVCHFAGRIPSSLANLTELNFLSLRRNGFRPGTLSWLDKLTKLTVLDLAFTNSQGDILSSLKNLTQLTVLRIFQNQFSSQIPSWLGNLTQLTILDLGRNKFWGQIPQSIFSLVNLEALGLERNNLSGAMKLESFLNLKNLYGLQLSGNNFSLLTTTTVTNVTVPKFTILTLGSSNLLEFPDFLSGQDELEFLDLSGNKIDGFIPKWIWGFCAETLEVLDLGGNFLTGFHQPLVVPPWTNLRTLDLSSNKLGGSLPIPSASIYHYFVSDNLLTGEIPSMICNLTSITTFDLSNNKFSGTLPPCLGNLSSSLSILNLQNNNFHGLIPQSCKKGSKLRMIDISQNQLDGQIPRSLVNCNMLEFLNLGNNQIVDTFPSWLGRLPELRILILRHNGFHGAIGKPKTKEFPKLRIFDLSFNKFIGRLPSRHFQLWRAMKFVDVSKLRYLEANTSFEGTVNRWYGTFSYSMTMTNKGTQTKYEKILEFLVAIDLSSNRFEGCIPEDIQILKAIQFLNLSNNLLSGPIPSSLANLTGLESLDLSQNKLSGEIPQELAQLTFIAFFNVSNNHLIGPIPQGKQFATFENNSFEGNPGLCGNPLSKKCYAEGSSPPPPSLSKKDRGRESWLELVWKAVLLGYGSGLVNGLVLGYSFNPMKHKWFVKCFGVKQQNRRGRN